MSRQGGGCGTHAQACVAPHLTQRGCPSQSSVSHQCHTRICAPSAHMHPDGLTLGCGRQPPVPPACGRSHGDGLSIGRRHAAQSRPSVSVLVTYACLSHPLRSPHSAASICLCGEFGDSARFFQRREHFGFVSVLSTTIHELAVSLMSSVWERLGVMPQSPCGTDRIMPVVHFGDVV